MKKKKGYKTIIFILFIFNCFNVNAQFITLNYEFIKTDNSYESPYFIVRKQIDGNPRSKTLEIPYNTIDSTNINNIVKQKVSYNILDTTIITLSDTWGHQLLIMPSDDTINISVKNKISSDHFSIDSLLIPWNYRLEYSGKYKAVYQLLDSMDIVAGSTHFDKIGYKNLDYGIDYFFKKCNSKFEKRLQFLEQYSQANNISVGLQNIVKSEIKSAYILNLLQAFIASNISVSDFPPAFIDSLSGNVFDDDKLFERTRLYSKAAYQYAVYFLNRKNSNANKDTQVKEAYSIIKNTYRGKVKSYCITNLLSYSSEINFKLFDSLLQDYKKFYLDSNSIIYLDSIKQVINSKATITLKNALASEIIDHNNKRTNLSSLFKGKSILIDCWATWCKPCINEMQESNYLQNKYKNDITIIFLSFDENKVFWHQKNKQFGLKNSYLAVDGFNNDIAKYFKINSIPRYILIDKNGKVVNDNFFRPSDKLAVKKAIKNHINKKI